MLIDRSSTGRWWCLLVGIRRLTFGPCQVCAVLLHRCRAVARKMSYLTTTVTPTVARRLLSRPGRGRGSCWSWRRRCRPPIRHWSRRRPAALRLAMPLYSTVVARALKSARRSALRTLSPRMLFFTTTSRSMLASFPLESGTALSDHTDGCIPRQRRGRCRIV